MNPFTLNLIQEFGVKMPAYALISVSTDNRFVRARGKSSQTIYFFEKIDDEFVCRGE